MKSSQADDLSLLLALFAIQQVGDAVHRVGDDELNRAFARFLGRLMRLRLEDVSAVAAEEEQ